MTSKSKNFLFIIALFTILSMLIAACASDATDAPGVEEPKEIVGSYAQGEDFLTLDPAVGMAMEMALFTNVYEGLTYTPEYDTQLALPLLATSWESSWKNGFTISDRFRNTLSPLNCRPSHRLEWLHFFLVWKEDCS